MTSRGVLLAVCILVASVGAAAGGILIVNTERGGTQNRGLAKIHSAIRMAGATQVRSVHFLEVTATSLAKEKPSALILSGQATRWTEYPRQETAAFFEALRRYPGPILGICGGHQALALAFDGDVDLLDPSGKYETGFLPVDLSGWREPLWEGLPKRVNFYFNHREHVQRRPEKFQRLAAGGRGANVAMRLSGHPVYGIQFHPEVDQAPGGPGQTVIKNFLKLAQRK